MYWKWLGNIVIENPQGLWVTTPHRDVHLETAFDVWLTQQVGGGGGSREPYKQTGPLGNPCCNHV